MNCICDEFRFPPEIRIAAGRSHLKRQTGTFAEFRRALLRSASIRSTADLDKHPLWSARFLTEPDRNALKRSLEEIGKWRGRHPQDFGVMLIEMWAYVCDLISFYDEVLAHETYVRSARRRTSLRKLVAPLGYIPRPAVAALAELALFAEGRKAVSLPIGTAFRSGAFDGNPPQVFELGKPATIHPLLNQWTLRPVRPPFTANPTQFLLCQPGTVSTQTGDVVLARLGALPLPRNVTTISEHDGVDGERYIKVTFDWPVTPVANTPLSSAALLRSTAVSAQWKRSLASETAIGSNYIYLDSLNRQIRKGQPVVLRGAGSLQALTVDRTEDSQRTLIAASTVAYTPVGGTTTNVAVPAVTAPVSLIYFTTSIDSTLATASPHIDVYHGFADGGRVTTEALTEIDEDDALRVRTPVEMPRGVSAPGAFQLEDRNGDGLGRPGVLNFASGEFSVQGAPWPSTLIQPTQLYGNIVAASRGETVSREVLGTGDTTIANQSFVLKKSPLTYLPTASAQTPSGLTSTLTVYVDGLRWSEVPSFFGRRADDEIYIVRANDKNESIVTFGDGVRGRRLSTGSLVMAHYRKGAGAATPPAGSVTQIAKPVAGLKSVRSPVAPFGGEDAESAASLQKYAPRSALLLGRAVSLADLEAAAASHSGVRAVAAEWRWSEQLQVPAAHIWYLADGDLTKLIRTELDRLTQPNTPIQVVRAVPLARTLAIQLQHDERRFEEDVLTAVRAALMDVDTGLLPPERLGIGKPLFRSRIFELVLNVPGVASVTGLRFQSAPFTHYGIKPPAGRYFDFSTGLSLNGRYE